MITKTVPSNILLDRELNIPEPLGELVQFKCRTYQNIPTLTDLISSVDVTIVIHCIEHFKFVLFSSHLIIL